MLKATIQQQKDSENKIILKHKLKKIEETKGQTLQKNKKQSYIYTLFSTIVEGIFSKFLIFFYIKK